eukprot:g42740.t1
MVSDQKVVVIIMYRAQMLHEMVPESALGLTDVPEATSGAMDTIVQVGECTGEPLLEMKSLFWALSGGEGLRFRGRGSPVRSPTWTTGSIAPDVPEATSVRPSTDLDHLVEDVHSTFEGDPGVAVKTEAGDRGTLYQIGEGVISGQSAPGTAQECSQFNLVYVHLSRMRGDLIETYKFLMGLDRLEAGRMFPMLGEVQYKGSQSKNKGMLTLGPDLTYCHYILILDMTPDYSGMLLLHLCVMSFWNSVLGS